jgi:acyl-CoA synthetase (NDP forming)
MFNINSLSDLQRERNGNPVDLLIIAIPAKGASKLIRESFDKGIALSILVITGRFGETEKGEAIQNFIHDQLFSLPHSIRPVLNGPNTLGNVYEDGLDSTFIDNKYSSSNGNGKRNFSIISQSGAFLISRISDLAPLVFPHVGISVGNHLDLTVTDFLEYFINDSNVTTYGLYIERLNEYEGIRLINLVKKVHDQGKTVVVLKSGKSQAGMRAAKGHTAAMAGDYGMFKSHLELAGALIVEDLEKWNKMVALSTVYPELVKKAKQQSLGVAVITNWV